METETGNLMISHLKGYGIYLIVFDSLKDIMQSYNQSKW